MNKIILDNNNIINIKVKNDSICNIDKSYNIHELNIEIYNGVKFIINQYSEIEKSNLNINIKQNNESVFIYNHSFINNKEYKLNINIELLGNNSKNVINIHGLSDNGQSNIIIDGKVNEKTIDNELEESIKMININEGKSYIGPNMFIDTKNVVANHSASISTVNKEYLFYLESKGIDEYNATKLLIDGFLFNDAK